MVAYNVHASQQHECAVLKLQENMKDFQWDACILINCQQQFHMEKSPVLPHSHYSMRSQQWNKLTHIYIMHHASLWIGETATCDSKMF